MKMKIRYGVMLGAFAGFIILSIAVLNGRAQSFNGVAYETVSMLINPALTRVMIIITNMGDWYFYVPAAIIMLALPKLRIKMGIPATLTLLVSVFFNQALKHSFTVPRPDVYRLIAVGGYGFPSGHAMNAVAFFGMCTYLYIRTSDNNGSKCFSSIMFVLPVLLIGFSRVYLGAHTATDVLGGYMAGMFVLAISAFVFEKGIGEA